MYACMRSIQNKTDGEIKIPIYYNVIDDSLDAPDYRSQAQNK